MILFDREELPSSLSIALLQLCVPVRTAKGLLETLAEGRDTHCASAGEILYLCGPWVASPTLRKIYFFQKGKDAVFPQDLARHFLLSL